MCNFPRKKLLAFLLTLGLSQTAVADDIDILSEILPNGSNILFIMDLSGSMQWDLSGIEGSLPAVGQESRVDVLRGAFQDIINDTDFDNINIGLSVFSGAYQNPNGWNGGAHGITYPIAPIQGTPAQTILSDASFTHPGTSYMPSAGTQNTREYLTSLSASSLWDPLGGTPIVDALYEGVLYFRGENVDLGRHFPDDVHAAHPATYTGSLSSVPGSCTTNTLNLTRADPTGGTNCVTNTINRVKCAEGETSCGLGTNCASQAITPATRICDSSFTTISQCTTANPSYYSCTVEPIITCSTNAEGMTTCGPTGSQIICKEDQTRYFCDATPTTTYTCDFEVEQCDPASTGGTLTYKSPIDSECPSNGIILLTDGMPTSRTKGSEIQSLIGTTTCVINDYDSDGQDDFSGWDVGAGQCGIELAEFMNNTDHNTSVTGNQTISLYTIGLSLGVGSNTSAYLYDLATHGGGSFVAASNRAQLTAAFKQAIVGISKRARSFSAPTYTINTSTLLSHSEYVYVPVFNRTATSFWNGNLKKYRLSGGELYGKGMVKATDATGKLLDDVSDLWSATATSVSATESGGAANKLNHASRNVLTDNGSALVNISTATSTQLGVSSADKTKLINFIRGENLGGTSRFHMGDIIHSKPVQLMTGSGSEGVVFVGTNEGFLHAIQSSTGNELFAYMPQELLKNIKPQFNNTALEHHIYGVDAPITLSDTNNNGIKEAGESASIYFGLRRGGKAYYGLDVTDPANPSLKWKFTHSKLGYTWSQPTVAKLKHGGSSTADDVLIFGGGYIDDNQLDSTTPDTDKNADHVAAAVFIINANTGSLIKMITGSELEYAVPSKIKVLDVDRNGSADRLYFSDTGGNVLRVDLDPNKDNSISDYKLTKLASLGGTGADQRKFFNEPDVALFKRGGKTIISVSIGSGKRPKPLDTSVNNYFYMLLDENVYNVPSSSQNITPSDLYDAPLAPAVNLIAELSNPGGKRGWKISLDQTELSGEKALSSSVTFQNKVMFTTFGIKSITTSTNNGVVCGEDNTNQSSLYVLDLLTGKAALDLNDDGTVSDSSDSPVAIGGGGEIPETPQVIRSGFGSSTGGACSYTDCREIIEIHTGNSPKIAGSGTKELKPIPPSKTLPKVYWIEKDKQ